MKWINVLQSGYWKARENPDPQEVLDAAIILYSLQCISSDVEFGSELQKYVIADRRLKTNEDYFIVLLSPAVAILQKYDFNLPLISNQKYNDFLKVAACYAHIEKTLTTHCARHTFAVFALNSGVPIEVVSKMLGHTNIKTTQLYAKILNTEVEKGFDLLESRLSTNSNK